MLDWIGSLEIRERTKARVTLGLSGSTQIAGAAVLALGTYLAALLWSTSPWLALLPGVSAALGAVLMTLRRRLVFDRDGGILEIEQHVLGLSTRTVVPLFHLRAVVVVAREQAQDTARFFRGSSRFVAYLERRAGGAIYLDEARRCARLMRTAEVIAEVAELRLEYDAAPRAAGD